MKGMKGRFLRKLKSISTITALKQNIIFQANPSSQTFHAFCKEQADPQNTNPKQAFAGGSISAAAKVNQLIKDDGDDDEDDETQNFEPFPDWKGQEVPPSKDHPPDAPIACTVPLPGVQHLKASENCDDLFESKNNPSFNSKEPPSEKLNVTTSEGLSGSKLVPPFDSTNEEADEEENGEFPSLLDFEEKCPPGGGEAVILYTTSLRGIRKTFEDCSSVRFLLESFRVIYTERDVSMHLEFREELWRILGGRVVPPRLFIRGRHVGGADEVVGLHEQGRLKKLLRGIPLNPFNNGPCGGCGGARFVVCSNCNGGRKIVQDELTNGLLLSLRCPECNENGLVKCPVCCC